MDNRSFSERIDAWLAAFPQAEMERELGRLREHAAKLQEQLQALQDEYGMVALELTKVEQALDYRNRLVHGLAAVESTRSDEPALPRKRGRGAVLAIIREREPDREWRAQDVYEAMVERGWMEPGEDLHPINVALSRLFRSGDLYRPQYGVYTLTPPSDEAETPTNVQSQDGNGSQGRGDLRTVTEGLPLGVEGAPGVAHQAGS